MNELNNKMPGDNPKHIEAALNAEVTRIWREANILNVVRKHGLEVLR